MHDTRSISSQIADMSLVDPLAVFSLGALGVVLYQAFVTARLLRFSGYTSGQKVVQVCLVWSLPLLGAYIVHAVIRTTEAPTKPADRDFTPQGPQSVA